MKKCGLLIIFVLFISACAVYPRYYLESNLNSISIGQTKQQLLEKFPGEAGLGGAPPMQIRAAQKIDDKHIEIGELKVTNGTSIGVAYWFLFEDSVLTQWGQQADWEEVKARYGISYNPPN